MDAVGGWLCLDSAHARAADVIEDTVNARPEGWARRVGWATDREVIATDAAVSQVTPVPRAVGLPAR